MEGILQNNIDRSTLQLTASSGEKTAIAAEIVAAGMRPLGIRVTSSSENEQFIFTHENCVPTSDHNSGSSFTFEEDVREVCGQHSIVLSYEYQREPFTHFGGGQIRVVDVDNARCVKYYKAGGTNAFRFDSFLSHMSIMRGTPCKAAAYHLPQGRVALCSSCLLYTSPSPRDS